MDIRRVVTLVAFLVVAWAAWLARAGGRLTYGRWLVIGFVDLAFLLLGLWLLPR